MVNKVGKRRLKHCIGWVISPAKMAEVTGASFSRLHVFFSTRV
ncbi:unnamed protein product [Brassica oleracea var. botrytis]